MNDEVQPVQPERKRHYHLFSVMVIYKDAGKERRQFLNTISPSEESYVNTMQLARVQQETQVRFQTVFDPTKKCQLLDLYVQSISYLGHMTRDEFDGGFSKLVNPLKDGPAPANMEDDSTPPEDQV
jgi:hypothetical protein